MPRLFIAIKIQPRENLLNALETIQQAFATDPINWVKPDNLHITLKFLGDTPPEDIPSISSRLKQCATALSPFDFSIKNFGYFGNLRFPRVLWMGIEQEEKNIENAFRLIQKEMDSLGFREEKQVFKPHLTIGRIKKMEDTRRLRELESEFSGTELQQVQVDSFTLFKSKLTSTGPVYSVVEKFSLQQK